MKLTTETDARPTPTPAPSGSPIHAAGAMTEGPRPSGAGRPICGRCGQPLPAERVCRCGCGRSLAGRRPQARYALPACRTRGWRKPSQNRHSRAGGLQVSYRRMVDLLAVDYALLNLPDARRQAEKLVREALPERQRARLDERGKGTE